MSFNGIHHGKGDIHNNHFQHAGQARHIGQPAVHTCCPSQHGGQQVFGGAISTSYVQNTVHQCQCKIGQTLHAGGQANIANSLREISKLLDGLMAELGGQAGKKGACSAAGQMTTQMQALHQATPVQYNQAQYMTPEIHQILTQITNLLTKLAGTMHTDLKAHTQFQKHR